MGQYRKKPIVIEAERFDPGDTPHPEGVYISGHYCTTTKDGAWCSLHAMPHQKPLYRIDTLEGGHAVTPGDWIITGIQGERYLCKPDIFEATYEPV